MLNGWKLKKQRGISVQAQCGSIFLGSAEIAMGKAKAPVIKNCSTYKQQSVSMKGKGSSTGLKRPSKQPKWFHCYGITHLLRTLCKWQYWLYRYGGTCHWGSEEDSLFRLTLTCCSLCLEWVSEFLLQIFSDTARSRKVYRCNFLKFPLSSFLSFRICTLLKKLGRKYEADFIFNA